MSEANITNEVWQATLDLIPKECIVHSREGGGPENLEASVAISIAKLAMMYERQKKHINSIEEFCKLLKGKD